VVSGQAVVLEIDERAVVAKLKLKCYGESSGQVVSRRVVSRGSCTVMRLELTTERVNIN
jgi:hypothetical protein